VFPIHPHIFAMTSTARVYFTVDLRAALSAHADRDGLTESDVLLRVLAVALRDLEVAAPTGPAPSDSRLGSSHADHQVLVQRSASCRNSSVPSRANFRSAGLHEYRSTAMVSLPMRRTLNEFVSPRRRVEVAVPAWTANAA